MIGEVLSDAERRRQQRGWYFYDFANSAFASTVLTLLLGPYMVAVTKAAAGPDGLVRPLGIPIDPRSWWSYVISLSVIMQIVVLPAAGALADRTRHKKRMLAVWAYIGVACTLGLFFVEGANYWLGTILFLIANSAFGASIVVYNSFLPEIATPEERDRVSSKGWGLGYLGGGLALALNLVLFFKAKSLGISEALATRINLASAGVWWGLFTIVPLIVLRDHARPVESGANHGLGGAFTQLWRTLVGMRAYPRTLQFLVAYLIYNDAVQAVIALSGQFGADELNMPMSSLAMVILMVQFVAFAGALIFDYVSRWIGAKSAVMVSLLIWSATLIAVYVSIKTPAQFFIMAAVIAIVLGGTQALSRSIFSQMIPKGREAEYFSLYEISDKGTSWLAPLLFGLALQFTHSYRVAILSLIVFFIAGLLVLMKVDVRKAAAEAGNT